MRVRSTDYTEQDIFPFKASSSDEQTPWCVASDFPSDPNAPSDLNPLEPRLDFTQRSLIEHVRQAASRDANKIAIDDGDTAISYGDLLIQTGRLAARIAAATKDKQAVGLMLRNSVGLHVAILACLAAKRPYIAMDLTSPAHRNKTILEQSSLTTIVVDGEPPNLSFAPSTSLQWLRLKDDQHTDILLQQSASSTDEPAIILYTSGSTGVPKGVANSERAVLERVRQYIHSGGFTADDVFLPLSSACTIAGARECFTALSIGATLMLASPEKSGLSGIRAMLRGHKVTVLNGVPALLRALMTLSGQDDGDFKSLRMIKVGGDRVLWSDVALFRAVCGENCRFQAGYSSTETTATYWEVPPLSDMQGDRVPAGYLHSSVAYRIETENGQQARNGEEGELIIKSPFIALGYWQNGHLQPASIETDRDDPTCRIFHTGDLVRQLPSGLIDVVGRKDRQVKINGKRVEPTELEVSLRQTQGVNDAAVIAVKDDKTTRLVAFVVLDRALSSKSDWISILRGSLRATVPTMLNPARIHAVSHIPRLPSGKQDTVSLLAMDRSASLEDVRQDETYAPYGEKKSGLDQVVSHAWRAVLGDGAFRENRSWDEAGGDSLSLLRFVFHLEALLGHPLPLNEFRMNMRPADCVVMLGKAAETPVAPPADLKKPTVFLFPGLTGDSPSLASFRNDLAQTAHVVLIPYPDWREMARGARSLTDLAEAALVNIRQEAPDGPLHLIGDSFGGAVAFQSAATLLSEGRNIASFIVLDSQIETNGPSQIDFISRFNSLVHKPPKERLTLTEKILEQAGIVASHPISTRWLAWLADRDFSTFSPLWRYNFRNAVWEAMQARALHAWRTHEAVSLNLTLAVTLFVSEENRPNASADLGWGRRVLSLKVRTTQGDHHSMLRAPYRTALSEQVKQHLEAAFNQPNRTIKV